MVNSSNWTAAGRKGPGVKEKKFGNDSEVSKQEKDGDTSTGDDHLCRGQRERPTEQEVITFREPRSPRGTRISLQPIGR